MLLSEGTVVEQHAAIQEKQFILIAKQPFSKRKESNHSNKCAPRQHEDDIICHDTKVVFLLFKF